MDVYRQASLIVPRVLKRHGTAKSLCLEKQVQKKKQTFAVVCETIRNLDRINKILELSEFFAYYPQLNNDENKYLVIVMCYDAAIGRGINTRQHPVAIALNESTSFLKSANAKIPVSSSSTSTNNNPAANSNNSAEDLIGGSNLDDDSIGGSAGALQMPDGWKKLESDKRDEELQAKKHQSMSMMQPRYGRVNTLLLKEGEAELETVLQKLRRQTFRRSGVPQRRQRGGGGENNNYEGGDAEDDATKPQWDQHIPGLIVFPPGTDLHAHPMVKLGTLLLQDKASCLPAAVMFDKVPVQQKMSDGNAAKNNNDDGDDNEDDGDAGAGDVGDSSKTQQTSHASLLTNFRTFVDGCAAPGNKTSQMAEYAHNLTLSVNNKSKNNYSHDDDDEQPETETKKDDSNNDDQQGSDRCVVVAVERDKKRFSFMQERMQSLGAQDIVTCRLGAFQEPETFTEAERQSVDAILLDPSCSSSGVVSRIDVSTATPDGGSDDAHKKRQQQQRKDERVAELAASQLELLTYALTSFPNAKRVVYSTCSVFQQENEDVVLQALRRANTSFKKKHKFKRWTVSDIMPETWSTRGRLEAEDAKKDEEEGEEEAGQKSKNIKLEDRIVASRCIRCDPVADKTSGFFVARFDRR